MEVYSNSLEYGRERERATEKVFLLLKEVQTTEVSSSFVYEQSAPVFITVEFNEITVNGLK